VRCSFKLSFISVYVVIGLEFHRLGLCVSLFVYVCWGQCSSVELWTLSFRRGGATLLCSILNNQLGVSTELYLLAVTVLRVVALSSSGASGRHCSVII
jgi:hypothetical protein